MEVTWKNAGIVFTAIAGFLGMVAMARPVLQSDAAPWASITRIEGVSAQVIAGHIDDAMHDYCEAERMDNRTALVADERAISALETDYADHADGRAWPLRPCP